MPLMLSSKFRVHDLRKLGLMDRANSVFWSDYMAVQLKNLEKNRITMNRCFLFSSCSNVFLREKGLNRFY